jgi:hypothetical protein
LAAVEHSIHSILIIDRFAVGSHVPRGCSSSRRDSPPWCGQDDNTGLGFFDGRMLGPRPILRYAAQKPRGSRISSAG